MCYFAAAIATLFFESPFIGLEKIIFGLSWSVCLAIIVCI